MKRVLGFVRTDSPTSARHENCLAYIRIWSAPPKRLIFWDGASSPYKLYQKHDSNLVMCVCVGGVRSPQNAKVRALAERRGKRPL